MNQNDNHYVMLHDEKRCIGCQACTVACRVLNDVPAAYSRLQVQIHLPEQETDGRFRFVRVSCQHCADAPCVSVCPTGASFRDDNGIVQVDKSRCIGCDYCVAACPFHVRYLDPRSASRISATSAAIVACRRGWRPPVSRSARPMRCTLVVWSRRRCRVGLAKRRSIASGMRAAEMSACIVVKRSTGRSKHE